MDYRLGIKERHVELWDFRLVDGKSCLAIDEATEIIVLSKLNPNKKPLFYEND
ncbi:MAG: hypothetical protein IMW92_06335 [Bacillales bacterium]|nr:hypothetical protein [Bacillales bacterium]